MKRRFSKYAIYTALFLTVTSRLFAIDVNAKPQIDLTKMNSVMVYAEMFNMLVESELYQDKTVKMKGLLYVSHNNNKTTYSCLVPDAAACCTQGIDLIFADNAQKSKLPKEGEYFTVYGRFISYEEDGFDYIALTDVIVLD